MKKSIFVLYVAILLVLLAPARGWASTVLTPTTGDSLVVGTVDYEITWTPVVGTTNVVIHYSVDGGVTWRYVTGPTPDDGSYLWTVPFTVSNSCKILVTDVDGYPGGTPSGTFSIVTDGVNRLIVTSPNGGEKFVAGKTFPITWLDTGTVGNVFIEYSTDGGTAWTTVVASTANIGSYSWVVPASVSEQCQVRVSEAGDNNPTDKSDANFSIGSSSTAVLNITYPNGGEGLSGSDNAVIAWTSNGTIANVKLEYTTDNGATWNYMATRANSDGGTYTWKVPNTPSIQCMVRVSDNQDDNPTDSSNATFSIIPKPGATDSITVTSPNGGEAITAGLDVDVTWTSVGAIGNVKIDYSTNNGGSWTTISAATKNIGTYSWNIPIITSSQCLIRITRVEETSVLDTSNSVFSIGAPSPAIWLLTPTGGTEWLIGTVQNITWQSYGGVGDVKIQYSTNNKSTWSTVISATANDGSYSWTIPNTPSTTCYLRISEASDGVPSYTGSAAFSIVTTSPEPKISLNRTELIFGALKSSPNGNPPFQTIIVNNGGRGTLRWSAISGANWLQLLNSSGLQTGTVTVLVDSLGIGPGTYTSSIIFSAPGAINSPLALPVTMIVYPAQGDAEPFGSFDSPVSGSTVMSSVPVTGWALDDVGIYKVKIARDAISGEGGGEVYVGDAVLVDGARIDVEQAYPGYPMNYKAGWGYMLLTNMLPNGGNGSFVLHAYAVDYGGHQVLLGSKSIVCDNANAVKPFGAIDSPSQGGTVFESNYRNQGWVLTPWPNTIPTNGSTIEAFVDGISIGKAHYNVYREDIATLFPGYANSNGSLAYLDFATTPFAGGVHTIQWTVQDNAGNTDGIGSRYFIIQHGGGDVVPGLTFPASLVDTVPEIGMESCRVKTGYGKEDDLLEPMVGRDGILRVTIPEMERLVLELGPQGVSDCTGYLQVGEHLRQLPIGSSLDSKNGVFYWQPGPGFIGDYLLVFVTTDANGSVGKQTVLVTIQSKFTQPSQEIKQ